MWDKLKETSVCWENPALISFSCGLMGITEDDLDPYVVFHIDVVIYLKDENNLHYFLFYLEKILQTFFEIILIWSLFHKPGEVY